MNDLGTGKNAPICIRSHHPRVLQSMIEPKLWHVPKYRHRPVELSCEHVAWCESRNQIVLDSILDRDLYVLCKNDFHQPLHRHAVLVWTLLVEDITIRHGSHPHGRSNGDPAYARAVLYGLITLSWLFWTPYRHTRQEFEGE
jgi:hypothetical protein